MRRTTRADWASIYAEAVSDNQALAVRETMKQVLTVTQIKEVVANAKKALKSCQVAEAPDWEVGGQYACEVQAYDADLVADAIKGIQKLQKDLGWLA